MIYDKQTKEKAKELYLSGLTYKEVSKIMNIKYKTLAYWGEKEKYGRGFKKFSDDFINEVVKKYENGLNTTELALEYNMSVGTIKYWIKKYSTPRHKGPKSKIGNEKYFDDIDTEEKAYYLGYIMADGNVSTHCKQYSLKIHINIQDREIIDTFLKAINSTNKTLVKSENKYYVSLTSVHMVNSLFKHGVIPRKTGLEELPCLSNELLPHFIRGFFDGDGITDIVQRRSGFVSAGPIIFQLKEIFEETFNEHSWKIQEHCKDGGMKYYQFLGNAKFSQELYKYMYQNATILLTRKRKRMDIICGNTEVISISNKMLTP